MERTRVATGGLFLLFWIKTAAEAAQLPDFVGFSYSRADVSNPSSQRFISLLNENLNINANFLPRYGSFEATRAGVYSFNFAFLSPRSEATVLALRKNGMTLVTALSEVGGLNPVSQAALTYLKPGDVVQLEIVQGRVDEGSDRAFTSFSGWLIGPTLHADRAKAPRDECCCPPTSIPTARPPYPPPSYIPNVIGPPSPPRPIISPPSPPVFRPSSSTKPTYIVTAPPTTNVVDWNYGRQENGRQEKQVACCDSLLLSTTSPDSLALTEQDEKFGVYRLQYVDRSPKGQGRATFKHIDRQLFLYYVTEPQVSGWIVGPRPGVSLGGLFVRSPSLCVEHVTPSSWQYYYRDEFLRDESVGISCFSKGYLDGRKNSVVLDDGKTHYHHHRHFHYHEPRSLPVTDTPSLPAYNLRANSKYVEATFLFPHKNETSTTAAYPEVIEAKREGYLPPY